ncbi:MAG: ATP-binding protein [Candidatus Krumholzibacteriia bacterium]
MKPGLVAALSATGLLPLAAHAAGLGLAAAAGCAVAGAVGATLLLRRIRAGEPAGPDPLFDPRHLRSVIDAIPHFIFARDRSGRFTLVNRSVAEFYGRPVEEIEGRLLLEVHPDRAQAQVWLEEDRETLARGETWSLPPAETMQASGDSIWITAIKKPLPTEIGSEPQVLGVSIDISEQVRAERALATRLAYEHAAATLFEEFVQCERDQMGRTMDRALGQLGRFAGGTRAFLYRIDAAAGAAALQYAWHDPGVEPSAAPPALLPLAELWWLFGQFARRLPVSCDDLRHHPTIPSSFRRVWGPGRAAFLAAPIMRNDRLFGFAGVDCELARTWTQEQTNLLLTMSDLFITVWSKHEVERSLVEAREAAETSNCAKSAFLANMSHEIRTPMNSVIGIADLLNEMNPTPQQRRYLEMIRVSGSALLSLINDILDLSKIEAGQLELDPVATDLHALADEVSGLIAFAAQRSGLELICRLAPGVPARVLLDPDRLRQVLTNLLNNAVKFTQHGHICLNIEPVGRREGAVDLRFEVSDTGIGISAGALERIFEKFTQAEAGTTRRFGGTGLGLAICRQLVGMMGGAITVRSTPGEGSTFSFTLPVPVLAAAAVPVAAIDPANVVVVTRLGLRGEVLREQIRLLGHAARVIAGGPEALDRVEGPAPGPDRPVTHLLYDQAADGEPLPDLRPWRRRFPPGRAPRTILLSPLTSHVPDDRLADHGFDGTLPKPVSTARLVALFAGAPPPATPTEAGAFPEPAPAPSDDDDPAADAATAGGPRVLLAEDNPFNQKVAVAMLRLLGCRAELAATGVEAVAMARDGGFDLVLMDCQMPTMDGYEATRRIRELPGPAGAVTIVAMTANALSGDRKACLALGMDDYLSKPVTRAMLSEMLRKWGLAGRDAARTAAAEPAAEPAPL